MRGRSLSLDSERRVEKKSNQKVTEREGGNFLFPSFLFSNSDGGQGPSACLPRGQAVSVICKHCLMRVCANVAKKKQKKNEKKKADWTHPPVPDTASCVCHGLLAHILDTPPQTFRKRRVCVRELQSHRECVNEGRGEGRPGASHSSVPPLTVANAALTSVMTSLLGGR